MGVTRGAAARTQALLLLLLLCAAPLLPACGGGGGGGGFLSPVDGVVPPPPGGASALRTATVVFLDPASGAPSAAPSRAGAPATVTVGTRLYGVNAAGLAADLPVNEGESIDLGGVRWIPSFAPGESLLVKALRPAGGSTTYAAAVYHRPATGGGMSLRSQFALAGTSSTRLADGPAETVTNGALRALLSDFLTRAEASGAAALNALGDLPAPPAVPNAALFAALPVSYANELTGELTLVIDPRDSRLGYGEAVQLVPMLRDARGLLVEVFAGWSVTPPDIVDVDTRGRVTAKSVPGTVTVTARFENLEGTASVTVLSAVDGTALSGVMTGDMTLVPTNDYTVVGDLTIPAGRTLTILGGTTVQFLANADNTAAGENPVRSEIIVEGTLEVAGLETQNVIFRSTNGLNPTNFDYFGIRVTPTGSANLERLRVFDAIYGAKCDGGSLRMVRCRVAHSQVGASVNENATGHLEANEITGCVTGIEMRQMPFGKILRNFVADNWYGINLYSADPTVWGNIVARHRLTGLAIHANSLPIVRNNLVTGAELYGIQCDIAVRPQVKWNVITHCPSFGVYAAEKSVIELRDNIFVSNYQAFGFRDLSRFSFEYNLFQGSELLNFINTDRRNDLYWGDRDTTPVDLGYVSTIPVSLSLFPRVLYGDPRFTRPDYSRPNLGDFSLGPTSQFADKGENGGPVGLLVPSDLGTASVLVGEAVE